MTDYTNHIDGDLPEEDHIDDLPEEDDCTHKCNYCDDTECIWYPDKNELEEWLIHN